MKIYKYLYTLPILLLLLSGCEDWLSIDPKSEIDTEVLFESQEGFSTAMNGIYTNLSSTTLYGENLKHGFVEVLAQTYTLNNSIYEVLEDYDYSSNDMKNRIKNIWSLAYNTIANCNSILEQVAAKDSTFFPEGGKRMIEGEALSVRAMLYFDLLRLFAPAPAVADEAAIPYYNKLSNVPMPYLKTSEILSYIIEDLKTSKALQKGFDTSEEALANYGVRERLTYNNDGFYSNYRRGRRMGYYATTALLAQVALYAGDNGLALENAMEFVDKPELIDCTPADEIEANNYNRLLHAGLIFALNNPDFLEEFTPGNFLISNVEEIFGTDGDDFRKKCYLENSGDKYELSKYIITDDNIREDGMQTAIPMFRLSQMYHIAIETMFDNNPQEALALFSNLRIKRGCKLPLPDILTKNNLLNYLINDARREFAGEGQLFYMYKRLNREIINEDKGNKTLTDEFIIPIPERETSFTNN